MLKGRRAVPLGFGVRRVRGEGTRRFSSARVQMEESGVSPVPRQPPQSKPLARGSSAPCLPAATEFLKPL